MIDIIIPAYNSHKTIYKTLISIIMQTNLDVIDVTIVNDGGKTYTDLIKLFKDKIKIREITLKKNSGPGAAREYGIENTNNKYIMFIDADDVLFDAFAIENMYRLTKTTTADLICGTMYEEQDNGEFFKTNDHQGCLHGKLYKRSFLEKHNIKFNDTRKSKDTGFNELVIMANPKIVFTDNDIYFYRKNKNSLTHEEDSKTVNIELYSYNICWAIESAEKRQFNKITIARIATHAFGFIYYNYIKTKDINILTSSTNLYKKYLKYQDVLYENEKYNILYSRFEKYPLIKFDKFLDKFKDI